MALFRKIRADDMSVPLFSGSNSRSSLIILNKWLRPFLGGINFSTLVLKKMAPTLSLLIEAEKESTAAISAVSSFLDLDLVPKSLEPLTSMSSITVSSLSSSKTLIYGALILAVTFQSILRTSSPY